MTKLNTIFQTGEDIELQYDSKRNLYVNGKKIVTEKKIKLRWIELTLAIIVAVSTLAQAIISILHFLNKC